MQFQKDGEPTAERQLAEGPPEGMVSAAGGDPEARLLQWRPAEAGHRESRYAAAFARARDTALDHHRELAEARSAIQEAARQLLGEPAERREMLLRNHPRFGDTRCGGWRLAAALIDEVEARDGEGLERSTRLAELAAGLAQRAVGTGTGTATGTGDAAGGRLAADTAARAWRVLGDLQRRQSDLAAASESVARARRHLRRGSGDPLERAALLEATGRVLSARGRRRARAFLAGAAKLYAQLAETDGEARSRVCLALDVLGGSPQSPGGSPQPDALAPAEIRQAVDELRFGLDLLDLDSEPELSDAGQRRLREVSACLDLDDAPALSACLASKSIAPMAGFSRIHD